MGINTQIRDTRNAVVTAINESQLPPSVVVLILESTLTEVRKLEAQAFAQEAAAAQEEVLNAEEL